MFIFVEKLIYLFLIMDLRNEKPIGRQLKETADSIGTSLSEVSRRSGVSRDTLERMKNFDSLTIKSLKSVQAAIDEIVTEKTLDLVTKKRDHSGRCYWIPNTIIGEFDYDFIQLSGKNYSECPMKFEDFNEKYSSFITDDENKIPMHLLNFPICTV